ncbi:MAG: SDR family oxidoreductase [Pseudomonadota bacterium]
MTKRLTGKRALITAAGQGIGRATALAMAAEGAEVIATDINADALAELKDASEGAVETQLLNVRDPSAIAGALPAAQMNVLFNCAGVVHHGSILNATDEDLEFAFDLNVRAMWHTIRAALPGMIERGGGSVINMSSVLSSVVGAPNRCVYSVTKAAVIGLTKSVAHEYVTQGIRCNAICPGTVDSPSFRERVAATGDPVQGMKDFVARQPMGRVGKAEEIAALAVYLASDESAFTTGQALVVDGGWTT